MHPTSACSTSLPRWMSIQLLINRSPLQHLYTDTRPFYTSCRFGTPSTSPLNMASYTNGTSSNGEQEKGIPPKITLYTNHGCPFAHRAHIALKELGLPYEEVLIDLDTPREPWYLEINPVSLALNRLALEPTD